MQSSNRLLGDIARLASGAMTMAAGAKTELEQHIQQRVERFLNEKKNVFKCNPVKLQVMHDK